MHPLQKDFLMWGGPLFTLAPTFPLLSCASIIIFNPCLVSFISSFALLLNLKNAGIWASNQRSQYIFFMKAKEAH